MNILRDVWIVFGKEWRELRSSDSGWVTASTLGAFLAIVGVFLPWQIGVSWIAAPWPILMWGWIPLFIVTTVTSDAVAGERERRTLETLLATRLSDTAILWGKWLACVVWVWAAMAICYPVSIFTLNLALPGGPHLPTAGQAIATLSVSFAGAGLGAAAGVLASLKAESVRHAQQVLAIGALIFAFVPMALLKTLPLDSTSQILGILAYGSPTRVSVLATVMMMFVSLPMLWVASMRFRRGKIPLK